MPFVMKWCLPRKPPGTKKVNVFGDLSSSSNANGTESLDSLAEALNDIHSKHTNHNPNFAIMGDFNAPDIDRDHNDISGNSDAPIARKCLHIAEHFGPTQHQKDLTRPASNNVLDLVFSSNPKMVSQTEVVHSMSDHSAIITMTDVKSKPHRKSPRNLCLYKRANFDKLRQYMSSFSNTFLGSDPLSRTLKDNWTMLNETLLTGIKNRFPTKMTKTNRSLS